MSQNTHNFSNRLIPIDEFIKIAQDHGYKFGKGNPKNRLRYLTKEGVIPRAVRKQLLSTDSHTTGFYPESAVKLLLKQQDLKKAEHLSVQEVSRLVRPAQLREEGIAVRNFPVFGRKFLYAGMAATFIAAVLLTNEFYKFGKGFLASRRQAVQPVASDQILGDEESSPSSYSLLPTAYSLNLLKNSSFETTGSAPSAFWTFHPNSTDGNTRMSNHTAHSGGYSLLVTADTGGVIQESTKTETGKSYQLGVWVKLVGGSKGLALRIQGETFTDTRIHLALGPGYDKSFPLSINHQPSSISDWEYYSTTFNNPPPGLVPKIYVNVERRTLSVDQRTTDNAQRTANNESFLFLDDAVFSEAESFAGVESKEYGGSGQLASAYSLLPTAYSSLLPTAGNVLSVSPQGIIYPTDSTQTQGGIGTESSRMGKMWGSNIDISQSLSVNEKIDISGKLTANGNMALGNNDGDEIEVGGRFISDLVPKQSNAVSVGTSTQRWNNLFTATGNISNTLTVGGATTITGLLTVNGGLSASGGSGLSVTGDLALDGDLDFQGPQNITTTSDNLTISPTGNLIIDTSGGTISIRDSVIDTTSQPLTLSTNTFNLSSAGSLTLRSTGTFILDTSAGNTNLLAQTGTGDFNVNNGQLIVDGNGSLTLAPSNSQVTVTGNVDVSSGLDVTGTTTLGDGGTTNYLSISNTGDLTLLGSANNIIANNDLVIRSGNSLTLDTSANNTNLVLQGGTGGLTGNYGTMALTSTTDTSNSISISAARGGITLSTSNASSNGTLSLLSAGTLTLDTSSLNSNLRLQTGTGSLTASTGSFNLSAGSGTANFASSGNMSLNSSGQLTFDDQWTTSPVPFSQSGQTGLNGNFANSSILGAINELASGGVGIWIDSNGSTAGGTVTVSDTTSSLNVDLSGTIALNSVGAFTIGSSSATTGALTLKSTSGGITLSTSGLTQGELRLQSAGTLILDTSRNSTPIFLQGGLVRVGSGGTVSNVSGSGSLYVQSNLEVDGDVYLGATTANNLTLTGQISSNLIPSVGSSYNLGSTTNRWKEIWGDSLTVTTLNSSVNNFTGITSNTFTIDTSNASNDTENISITFERGIPGTNSQLLWDAANKYFSLNAAFNISPETDITTLSGENAILNVNDSYGGRRIATFSESGTPRAVIDSSGNILLYQSSNIETSSGTLTMRGYNGLTLTTSSATTGEIRVLGRGSLTLDTSALNAPIVFLPGTNNVGIGSTAPAYKLDVNGTGRFSGDLTLDGDLDFTGSQNITTTADDLTLSPTGNLIVDTSGGTVSIRDAAIDLTNQPATLSANTLTLRSTGTFILDTSANNTDLRLQAGSGNINLSSATTTISGNVNLNSGTLALNGLTYTFPGSQSANNVLLTNGSGLLSWTTLGGSSITNDSLDFAQFDDSLDLDADTSINGPYSFVIRAGQGAIENSTSGNNDLQLTAADKLILAGASFDLSTSSGAVDIISNQRLDLSAGGTLTLDTSANNSNILLKTGSGNINVSTGTLTMTGVLDVRDSTGTLGLVVDSTGNVGIGTTGPSYKLHVKSSGSYNGWFESTSSGSGIGLVDSSDAAYLFTESNKIGLGFESWLGAPFLNGIVITSSGNLGIASTSPAGILDIGTSAAGILLRAGQPGITISSSSAGNTADIQLAAPDRIDLFAGSLSLQTSSQTAGELKLMSKGSLILDTSATNAPIVMLGGNVGIGTTGPGTLLHIASSNPIMRIADTSTAGDASITKGMPGLELISNGMNTDFPYTPAIKFMSTDLQLTTETPKLLADIVGRATEIYNADTSGGMALDFATTPNAPGTTNVPLVRMTIDSTGNIGIGTTSPAGLLDTYGDKSILLRAGTGAVSISGGAGAGADDIQLAAEDRIDLFASSFSLSTSSLSAGDIKIDSAGTLTMSTSRNNANIQLLSGSGYVGIGTTAPLYPLHAYRRDTQSVDFIGMFENSVDDDSIVRFKAGSATDQFDIGIVNNNFIIREVSVGLGLQVDPAGNIGVGRADPQGVLDVIGNLPIILRAGQAAINNSTSGTSSTTADIQIAAADRMDLFATSYSLTTSGNSIDMLSGGRIDLSAKGTLTLDTSQNNANILMTTGSGNINVSTGTLTMTGVLDVRDSTGTLGLVVDSTGNVGVGTTGPTKKLQISDNSTTISLAGASEIASGYGGLWLSQTTPSATNYTMAQANNGSLYVNTVGTGTNIYFRSANANELVTILGSGNVGIGTTGPLYTLDVSGGTRVIGDAGVLLRAGRSSINLSSGTTSTTADLQLAAADRIDLFASSLSLQTSSQTAGELKLMSKGSLILDTSGAAGGGAPIVMLGGNVGIGTTSPLYTLDVSGGTRVIGDAGVLLRAGRSSINLSSGTTSTTADLQLAAADRIDMFASSFNLTTSNTSDGSLKLTSYGNLTLDTSQNNGNVIVRAGTGNINLSSGTTTISGNVNLNSGTLALNGIAYTFPGADGSASNVLTTSGAGLLSWGTLGAASITADSLDFSEFKDELTLDADTTINGDYSLIVRAGLGSIQNSTSGSNDLQLSAEDKLILAGASFDLSTSNGAVDIISNQRLDLSAGGTLTLDTSSNNSNILLKTGSGNINVSTGTLTMTGVLDVRDSTGTLGLVVDSTGNVGIGTTSPGQKFEVNGNVLIKNVGTSSYLYLGSQYGSNVYLYNDNNDNLTIRTNDSGLNIKSEGTGTISFTAGSGVDMKIDNTGNVGIGTTSPLYTLDVSGGTRVIGDAGVLLRAGRSSINLSSGTTSTTADLQLAAADRIDLFASSLRLSTSSTTAGDMVLSSNGSMTFDTSGGTGKFAFVGGNVGVGTTAPSVNLHVYGASAEEYIESSGDTSALMTTYVTGTGDPYFRTRTPGPTWWSFGTDQSNSNAFTIASTSSLGTASDRMTILTGGNVGIGSTAPVAKLDVLGAGKLFNMSPTVATAAFYGMLANDINHRSIIGQDSSAGTGLLVTGGAPYAMEIGTLDAFPVILATNNAERIRIQSDGNVGIGSTSPQGILDVVGDYSIIMRAGLGAVQNSTSGNNDIQLAAEDRMDLFATSYSLTTSGNSIDMLSGGRIDLSAKGNLTLDTSQNNTNILLLPGSGYVGIGTTNPQNNLHIRNTSDEAALRLEYDGPANDQTWVLRTGTSATNFSIWDSSNNVFPFKIEPATPTNTLYLGSSGNIGVGSSSPAGLLDTYGDKSILLRAGTGAVSISGGAGAGADDIQLAAEDKVNIFASTFALTTSSATAGDIKIDSAGTFTLSTSRNNTDIVLMPGSGTLTLSSKVSTGTGADTGALFWFDQLSTGTGFTLSSSSSSFSTGNLALMDWSPQNPTVATGDLLRLNIGSNGDIGNLLNILDNGSSLFSVSESAITLGLPASFTSAGDVAIAYDLNFTNPTASYIKSIAPLYLQAGETFNSSDLTLGTYNYGELVADAQGGVQLLTQRGMITLSTGAGNGNGNLILKSGGTLTLDTTSSDTDIDILAGNNTFNSLRLRSDRGGIDISTGSANGAGDLRLRAAGTLQLDTSAANSNILLKTGSGNINVSTGTLTMTGVLDVRDSTGTYGLVVDSTGNVGVGTTGPGAKLNIVGDHVTGKGLLHLDSTGHSAIALDAAGTSNAIVYFQRDNTTKWTLYQDGSDSDKIKFDYGGTANLTLLSAGNLGIASTSPAGILDIGTSAAGILLRAGQPGITISSSSAGNTADIQLAAPDRIDLFAGSLSLQTSSQTAGELKLTSKGSLILDTSGAAGGGAPIVMLGGNVGIGSTAPGAKLDVKGLTRITRSDSVNYVEIGAEGGVGSISTGGHASSTQLKFVIGNTTESLEAMRINGNGNLGIGTTSPGGIFDVIGNSSVLMRAGQAALQLSGGATSTTADLQLAAADRIDLFAGSLSLQTSSTSAGDLKIISKGSLILDTSSSLGGSAPIIMNGNVGIGTTSPGSKLDINGGARVLSGTYSTPSSGLGLEMYYDSSQAGANIVSINRSGSVWSPIRLRSSYVTLESNGSEVLRATAGNVGIGTTSPLGKLDIQGDSGILLKAGAAAISLSSGTTSSSDLQLAAADRIDLFASSLRLSTSSTTAGELKLMSKGSLILDTSGSTGGTAPIILQGGNVGIGTTSPRYKFAVHTGTDENFYVRPGTDLGATGGMTIQSVNDVNDTNKPLVVVGNPTIMLGGNVGIGTTSPAGLFDTYGDKSILLRAGTGAISISGSAGAGADDIQLAAEDRIDLFASSLRLSTSSTTAGDMVLSSNGSMTFDTSGGTGKFAFVGGNIGIGTTSPQQKLGVAGSIDVGYVDTSNLFRLSYDTTNGGSLQSYIGGAYAKMALNPSGGNVGIGTTSPQGILDVVGDYSIIMRAGLGAVQNSTSGNNDIQLAAEDRMDLFATSYSLTTSGNSIDMLSGGRIDLSAKGNLTLDTSQNNTNILLLPGSGNVGVGTTSPINKLQVLGTNAAAASSGTAENGAIRVAAATSAILDIGVVGSPAHGWLQARDAGNYATNYDLALQPNGGNLGIGNNAPEFQLVVAGTTYLTLETSGTTNGVVCHDGDTTTLLYDCDAGPFTDYAEIYPTAGDVDYGEIVSTSNTLVETNYTMTDSAGNNLPVEKRQVSKLMKSSSSYQSNIIGITSRNYSDFTSTGQGSVKDEDHPMPVALNGRVPVKIAPDSEAVEAGDFLTPSATYPGMAMKATKAGYTVGKALEKWEPKSEIRNPKSETNSNDQNSNDPNVSNFDIRASNFDTIMVFVNISYYMGSMTADGYIDTGLKMKVADIMADTSQESSRGSEATVGISSGEIAAATPAGGPRNDGLLSLQTRVSQLEDLVAIMAGFASPELLTQAGTNTLTTSSDLLSIIHHPSSITGSYMDSEVNLGGSGLVSPLATPKLTLDVSTDTVQVLGSATIGGNLTIGLLTINDMDASINSIGETLKLQSLALDNIEIMAGKIVIDTEGNIKVGGNIEAKTVAAEEFKVLGSKSSGSEILRAGELALTVSTDVITPESKIFTQVISTPENAGTVQDNAGISLVVIKFPGIGFEVRLPAPAATDTAFDWFVIGGN